MKQKPLDLFELFAGSFRPTKTELEGLKPEQAEAVVAFLDIEVESLLKLHKQGDYSQDAFASKEALDIVKQKENPSA